MTDQSEIVLADLMRLPQEERTNVITCALMMDKLNIAPTKGRPRGSKNKPKGNGQEALPGVTA